MNFRKLLTYLTVGTAAVIPFAGAQNPTILQGSYISNVFGQSNFILNPNAQTNVANVTTVTATVTRSTTTPLVATSEFNVAIGTANGTATWATRAFDAGMKGQNCEARFSYRGFAATSKVHIKQNSNTVATLTLTPATDPRIASINFPCGDLSTATTFVVTDTAILAGTNEIGAIYTGLATNMANVAQAENVVQASRSTTQSFAYNADTTIIFSTETKDTFGEFDTSTGVFTAKRAGDYLISTTWLSDLVSWTSGSFLELRFVKGSTSTCRTYRRIESTQTMNVGVTTTCVVSLAVGDTLKSNIFQNQSTLNSIPDGSYVFTSISRFPTSSELVVTPERQNTFGGVVYTAETQSLFAGTAEPTGYAPFNAATWNQPTKLKGKASVTTTNSGNDLGFSVANLPVGNYKFDVTGLLNASTGGAAASTRVVCSFRLIETTTTTEISSQTHQDTQISIDGTRDYINAFTGVFNNTSVATRNFRIEAQKHDDNTTGNVGYCQAYSLTSASSNNTKIAIIMTPLDQPSNSALFVQGPVLGAQTGAAIPASYVGEVVTNASDATNIASGTTRNCGTLTLQPGVWDVYATQGTDFAVTNPNVTKIIVSISTTTGTLGTGIDRLTSPMPATAASGFGAYTVGPKRVNITSATPYYCVSQITASGNVDYLNSQLKAVRVN